MSKWHYICEDEIAFEGGSFKDGKYYCYHVDVFDRLLNDNDFIHANDAYEEHEWIVDQLDKMLESNDGSMIFIPTFKVATAIDNYYSLKEIETEENFIKEMDWPV